MSAKLSPEVEAWKRFCQRVEAMGERILAPDFPNAPEDTAEGIAHLADQVSCWLGWALAHADTSAPFFHRSNDLFTQWGGPNQDNAYHHARIDAKRRYRIRGKMHSCEHFVLTLRVGFMHMKEWGTKKAISSVDLGVGPGDDFEILLGGDGSEPDWNEIPEEVTTVSLREYYVAWGAAEPATFTIECVDAAEAPARLRAATVAQQLDHALDQVESSMLGWNDYLAGHRAAGTDNEFTLQGAVAKGLSDARYAFLFWDLAPGQLLLVESDVPQARYWGLQLATLGWFEPVDAVHRVTSINQEQAVRSSDGNVRFVVAHEDPGVPNWLDTAGHRNGLLTYRWFWPESDPSPSARVLDASALRDALPSDTPRVDAAARQADIQRRKEHLAWRFRT
ncbi:MAG: DUF1214 domain-containing protein [Myxococcales bacterium]|nr:DUF1214 domain-containing protein [Myxococcales bacterium]